MWPKIGAQKIRYVRGHTLCWYKIILKEDTFPIHSVAGIFTETYLAMKLCRDASSEQIVIKLML